MTSQREESSKKKKKSLMKLKKSTNETKTQHLEKSSFNNDGKCEVKLKLHEVSLSYSQYFYNEN